ncbi:integral membrane single C2 domain protein [Selaginella moellendorffii]|uniref:Integral membrane single C2 domain protein n=1 Tax=Selaginella moellendorffii TaxID=88036 RepID=D8RTE8_SELML|nr:synaptotagmin-5 [Selaginella moellendorffii]EFJ24500.1 integral membrane single C2 domain protein [Selaginella moellendorffii]|eukprot:XP_002974278.1 synaptotagmin-5 [Selaginella moellendorffii]
MEASSNLAWTLIREERSRIAIATVAALAPLVWGGLVWVSRLSFIGQIIAGTVMGMGTMGAFHYLGVYRTRKRMHKAVTIAQLSIADAQVLKRFLPIEALPSWIQNITDFEKVTWLNRELEEVWPFLDQAASEMIRMQIQPVLDQYKFGPIQKLNVKSVTLGKVAPMIGGIKFTGVGKNEAMVEVEVDWRHGEDQKFTLEVQTTGPDFTVQVKDFVFYGILRAVLKPLTDQLPCFGAAVVSLREPPTIDFKTKFLGGDLLQLPGLDGMIDEIIRNAVMDLLVWPNRMVIPILPGDYSFMEMRPVAYLEVHIIEAKRLLNKETFGKSDPFVYVYVRQKQELMQRTATKSNTSNPTWNEHFIVDVEDPQTQKLNLRVMDSDQMNAADFLGFAEIPIRELEPNTPKDMWVKLVKDPRKPQDEKNRGEIHLVVAFKPHKRMNEDEHELLPAVPEGAGVAPPTEKSKEDEAKKSVSTPEQPETKTATPAQEHDGGGGDRVTAGGLVLNRAARPPTNEPIEGTNPEALPAEKKESLAPSTPTKENAKAAGTETMNQDGATE